MESASPTARALLALEVLQDSPGVSAERLAGRLGVTDRAVRRYVGLLRDAGIPIESTTGLVRRLPTRPRDAAPAADAVGGRGARPRDGGAGGTTAILVTVSEARRRVLRVDRVTSTVVLDEESPRPTPSTRSRRSRST